MLSKAGELEIPAVDPGQAPGLAPASDSDSEAGKMEPVTRVVTGHSTTQVSAGVLGILFVTVISTIMFLFVVLFIDVVFFFEGVLGQDRGA